MRGRRGRRGSILCKNGWIFFLLGYNLSKKLAHLLSSVAPLLLLLLLLLRRLDEAEEQVPAKLVRRLGLQEHVHQDFEPREVNVLEGTGERFA